MLRFVRHEPRDWGNRYWSQKLGSTVYKTTSPIVNGQPALLVGKITFTENGGNMKLYVNAGLYLPAQAAASVDASSSMAFKNVVYLGSNGAVDELRFGASYGAVRDISGKAANIIALTDYYPFGSEMPGRKFVGGSYKYGYQGSERDAEINNDHYTTFYRPLDTKTARWWATDPVTDPSMSPYNAMDNNPILNNDPDGDFVPQLVGAFLGGGVEIGTQMASNYFQEKKYLI